MTQYRIIIAIMLITIASCKVVEREKLSPKDERRISSGISRLKTIRIAVATYDSKTDNHLFKTANNFDELIATLDMDKKMLYHDGFHYRLSKNSPFKRKDIDGSLPDLILKIKGLPHTLVLYQNGTVSVIDSQNSTNPQKP